MIFYLALYFFKMWIFCPPLEIRVMILKEMSEFWILEFTISFTRISEVAKYTWLHYVFKGFFHSMRQRFDHMICLNSTLRSDMEYFLRGRCLIDWSFTCSCWICSVTTFCSMHSFLSPWQWSWSLPPFSTGGTGGGGFFW